MTSLSTALTASLMLTRGSNWELDPAHSHVEFAVRHLMISTVKGRFADVQGMIRMDEADPSAVLVDVTIGVASIDTQQEERDSHLRSTDFFDVARLPNHHLPQPARSGEPAPRRLPPHRRLSLSATSRARCRWTFRQGAMRWTHQGRVRAGFSAHTTIDRTNFGLAWNQALEAGGVLVGNEVRISLEVELVRQAQSVAASDSHE